MTASILLAATSLSWACAPAPPAPEPGVDEGPPVEDIVAVGPAAPGEAPEAARLLLENVWVAVTEISLEPGGRLTFHRGGERIAYALEDHTLHFVPEAGAGGGGQRPSTAAFRTGQVGRHPSGAYTAENPGPGAARALVINRSSEPLPPQPAAGRSLAEIAEAAGARVEPLLDDPVFALARVRLPLGKRLPRQSCGPGVIYALGPGSLEIHGGGEPAAAVLAAGDAHWVSPGECAVESLGGASTAYLAVSLRR
jgi:hypothetical protein